MRRERNHPDSDWSVERVERFEASIESIELFAAGLAAAKAAIYRLKSFDKSAREQLAQHRLWLDQYIARETRDQAEHQRRLKRVERRQQRRHSGQRALQRYKKTALASMLFLRLCGLSLRNRIVNVLIYWLKLIFNSAAWIAAKVGFFGRLVVEFAYLLDRWLIRLIWICLLWSHLNVGAFVLSLVNGVAINFSWTRRRAYALALSAAKQLSIDLSRRRGKAHASGLALVDRAWVGYRWVLKKARDLAAYLSRLVSASITEVRRYRRRGFASPVRLARWAWVGVQPRPRSKEPTRLKLPPDRSSTSAKEEGDLTWEAVLLWRRIPLPKSISAQFERARRLDGALRASPSWLLGSVSVFILLVGSCACYLLLTRSIPLARLDEYTLNLQKPAGARVALTAGETDQSRGIEQPPQDLSEIGALSRESRQQIAVLDTVKPIEEFVASAKDSGHHDEEFQKSHAIDPRLVSTRDTSLPEEQLSETVTQNANEAARENLAKISPLTNEEASAKPPAGVASGDAEVSSLISQSASPDGASLQQERLPETVTQNAADNLGAREDLSFCRKWRGLGRIVCRKQDGTAIEIGPADMSALAEDELSAETSIDAMAPEHPEAIHFKPARLPRERLPDTVTQNAADSVDAREDLSFCRKGIGLGRIVCRKQDGTAIEVEPTDISNLGKERASAKPTASAMAVEYGKAAVPPSVAEVHNEKATEIDNGSIRFGIALGSASNPADLVQLWRQFLTSHVAVAAGLQPRRVLARDNEWRLVAGPFATISEATGACELLKKASTPCGVSVYAGDQL